METNWKRVVISDVCDLIVDCVNKTAPVVEGPTPYRMVRTPNIKSGRVSLDGCRYVVEETFTKWTRRAKVQKGDVLLTREAPLGEVGYVNTQEQIFLGQRIMQYRANPELLDSIFLLYSFLGSDLQHQFYMHEGSGSVVSHIRVGDCSKFQLQLPPLVEQKRIAHILGTLDDKIELNRKMNATLEEMAQALFKSWFVDFDPVIDNAFRAGNPIPEPFQARAETRQKALIENNNTPATHDHLFPNTFTQSEDLGWIPEGWELATLSDFLEVKYGKDHKKLEEGQTPVYGSGGLMRKVNASLHTGESVLIPRKGTLSNIMFKDEEFWTVDTMFYTIPKLPNVAKYSYYHLKTLDFNEMNVGSAVPSMTTKVLNSLNIVRPSNGALIHFNDLVTIKFSKKCSNFEEQQTLTKQRNALLPKLVSGSLTLDS